MRYYLEKARKRVPAGAERVQAYDFPANAVPDAITETRKRAISAETSAKKVEKASRIWRNLGSLAIMVAVLTMGALYWMTVQLVSSTQNIFDGNASGLRAQSTQSTIPSAYTYNQNFLTAQQLFLDYCALPTR